MWASSQIHATAALPLAKEPPVPIESEGGLVPEPVWTRYSDEKSLYPAWNRTPTVRPVTSAVPTNSLCSLIRRINLSYAHALSVENDR
jgi:hypothetical protein